MPLLDRECADLLFALYEYPDSPVVHWSYRDDGDTDSFPWAAKWDQTDVGCLNCVFAGTEDVKEALRDINAFPIYIDILDDWAHAGFWKGVPEAVAQIASLKPERIRITGHSYGAAHGRLVSKTLAALNTIPFSPPVLFGEPSSAFEPSPARSYAVRLDFIPLISPYPQASELIWLDAEPVGDDPLAYHHIQAYQRALANIDASTP
jgi:hypothetical protein